MHGTPSSFDYAQALDIEAASLERAAEDLLRIADGLTRRGRSNEADTIRQAAYARRVAGMERKAQSFALALRAVAGDEG